MTFNALASFVVTSIISFFTLLVILCAGNTQDESPEWIPASSICCIIPAIKTSLPSQSASTSNSNAFSIN